MSRRSTSCLDIIDLNGNYVNPSNLPEGLTPLPIQNELAFLALAHVRNKQQQF